MLNIEVEYKHDRVLVHGLSFNFACDMIESVIVPTSFKVIFMNGNTFYKDRKDNKSFARFNEVFDTLVINRKYIDKEKWNKYIKIKGAISFSN